MNSLKHECYVGNASCCRTCRLVPLRRSPKGIGLPLVSLSCRVDSWPRSGGDLNSKANNNTMIHEQAKWHPVSEPSHRLSVSSRISPKHVNPPAFYLKPPREKASPPLLPPRIPARRVREPSPDFSHHAPAPLLTRRLLLALCFVFVSRSRRQLVVELAR